jgi:uncharacterized protein (TIGR00297 family)
MMINFIIGFILSCTVAFIAYLKHNLDKSGLIASIILGTLVYGLGHWIFYVFMMFFFMSSLVIRKLVTVTNPVAHQALMHNHHKHEARNWIQVFANGGILLLISVIYTFWPSDLVIFVAALSMAAATSDTWASEIGILSHNKPVSILKHEPMETGLSGGVTSLGLWASLFGSALISLVLGLFLGLSSGFDLKVLFLFGLCTLGGFSGSLFDSILGELFQAKYKTTRMEIIEISTADEDVLLQGWHWFDNNLVNFLSNVFVVTTFSVVVFFFGLF